MTTRRHHLTAGTPGGAGLALVGLTALFLGACSTASSGGAAAGAPSPNGASPSATPSATPPAPSSSASASAFIDPGDGGDYHPAVDPARFSPTVDNPLFPLPAGATWTYEGVAGERGEHDVVRVTDRHPVIDGVTTTEVRDTVTEAGVLVEDTRDWYAQDVDGNVWYFGEAVDEYEHGVLKGHAGSWRAGVAGAEPGVIMPAAPTVGMVYRQEYLAGEAEDMARVIRVGATITMAGRTYEDAVVTDEWSPLEPSIVERKFYAHGLGTARETVVRGRPGGAVLVSSAGLG